MQTTEAEVQYAADMAVIVKLTNKFDFDFTPEMGARFGGVPYAIRAGGSILAPKPVAKLLAKHLARQSFIKNAPIRDEKETDGKGKDRPLWGVSRNQKTGGLQEEEVEVLAQQLISDAYTEEVVRPKSEAEIVQEKVAALNKQFETQTPAPTTGGFADKADVIAELEKRGIKHDKRQGKDKLEALLKENPQT